MADAPANLVPPSAAGKMASRNSGKKFATAALVLAASGAGIWWGFLRPRDANSANSQPAAAVRSVLPLESFTVNLADAEEGRFLRATMALAVEGQLPAITKGDNKPVETGLVSMATIRDSMITVLAQCTSDQLLTPDGKAKLKADLLNALNRDVPALRARDVYFTEFLVQR
jgi:flagellar basal body-associated protein FliL